VNLVNIYKCKYLADSCGSCILLHENYHCLWCETDKSCRHQINSSICKANHIISSSIGICPDPRLRQIYPKIGPQYGQTPIHIYGSSLGKKPHDISAVLINSNQTEYPCHIPIQFYIIAQSFICQLPSLPVGIYTIKVTVHSVVSKDRPIFQIVVKKNFKRKSIVFEFAFFFRNQLSIMFIRISDHDLVVLYFQLKENI
jgi:hypothetical protein